MDTGNFRKCIIAGHAAWFNLPRHCRTPYDRCQCSPIYLFDSYISSMQLGLHSGDIRLDNLLYAGGAFVIIDSLLGPLYLAWGVAEGGRESPYLFLGQTF